MSGRGETFRMGAATRAFAETRWRALVLRTRADLEAYQQRRIQKWLAEAVPTVGFYRQRRLGGLEDLPLVAKSDLMADFSAFNRLGLTTEHAWAHFRAGTAPPGHFVGASTGTSGNRGLYLISDRERARWLGTMLAKLLPRFPLERARVAVILPQNAALYRQPGRGGRLALRFFDLHEGFASLPARLMEYGPDTLVGPPKVLRFLAEMGLPKGVTRLYSGAEVLDAVDRQRIEEGFGRPLHEIYMATEGLLATTCREGRLHLAEDVMHFDMQDGPPGSGLVAPVISDFSRSTQIMARYRLNDLLQLSRQACPCGSPLRVVDAVVGRDDDCLLLPALTGAGAVTLTPDVLRNTILNAAPTADDFRCEQVSAHGLHIRLPENLGEEETQAVRRAVEGLLALNGAYARIDLRREAIAPPIEKLRRVHRSWKAHP